MSVAAAHAAAFYREVGAARTVWTVRDGSGYPAPKNADGRRSQPFWSTESRTRNVVANVSAYASFEVVAIPWETFRDRWLRGLKADGLLVGVNWSGPNATGYDIEPDDVRANVEHYLA